MTKEEYDVAIARLRALLSVPGAQQTREERKEMLALCDACDAWEEANMPEPWGSTRPIARRFGGPPK